MMVYLACLHLVSSSTKLYFLFLAIFFFSRIYRHNLRNLKFGSTPLNADDSYNDAICPACPKVHTVLYMKLGEKSQVDEKSTFQENMLLV